MRAFFIAMYQVHNKLNNTHLALMHYSWAMDLDPKVHSTRTFEEDLAMNHSTTFAGGQFSSEGRAGPSSEQSWSGAGVSHLSCLSCIFAHLIYFLFVRICCIKMFFCRLSVDQEDREEPMVSDADHHEDFQVVCRQDLSVERF